MEHSYDELIAMPKRIDGTRAEFDAPAPGNTLEVKLMSPADRACKFTLSIYEGKHNSAISLSIDAGRKTNMQTRHRSDALVRVDIDEHARHTNPDGKQITGSHVHIAQEGVGAKVAYPIDSDEARQVVGAATEIMGVFEHFRAFCNIESTLQVNWSLGI